MVFVPKRHREQETAAADNGPVAAVAAAEPIAETPKPAEQPEIKSPADGAALQARLAEMQRAEELVQQRQQPQFQPPEPPPSIEQMIEGAAVPENAKAWLRAHPDYVSDLDKNQELRGGHVLS